MKLIKLRPRTLHRLDIYVAAGCRMCTDARALAAVVVGWKISNLEIHVVDLGEPGVNRPRFVFAVPTYLLDGAVISLGNPSVEEIRERLEWLEEEDRCP